MTATSQGNGAFRQISRSPRLSSLHTVLEFARNSRLWLKEPMTLQQQKKIFSMQIV